MVRFADSRPRRWVLTARAPAAGLRALAAAESWRRWHRAATRGACSNEALSVDALLERLHMVRSPKPRRERLLPAASPRTWHPLNCFTGGLRSIRAAENIHLQRLGHTAVQDGHTHSPRSSSLSLAHFACSAAASSSEQASIASRCGALSTPWSVCGREPSAVRGSVTSCARIGRCAFSTHGHGQLSFSIETRSFSM